MSIASSRCRALAVTGVVSLGLVTSMAASASAATTAPAKPKAKGPSYVAEVMGPRAQAQPYPFGNVASGVSNAGEVLVHDSSGTGFVAKGRTVRPLADVSKVAGYANARVLTGSGDVYGSGHDVVVKWTRNAVTGAKVVGTNGGVTTTSVAAANDRGDIAGCANYYRFAQPFIGSYSRKTAKQLTWPGGSSGNCSVTGISDRGVAAVNQEYPNFRTDEIYPRAATMTTSGVTYLRTPKGLSSHADAISPDGTLVAGRVFKNNVATTSWLSTRRAPVTMRGAGAMTPKVVTNDSVVFGEDGGRVVSWKNGRKTDLTSISGLPRGWVLTGVSDINSRGQLAVTATIAGTQESVVMRLTPRR